MGLWPLPRTGLAPGGTRWSQARDLFRTGAVGARDVFFPLLVLGRGAGRLTLLAKETWARTPKERRGPALLLGAACLLVLGLTPYGPAVGTIALVVAAAWQGWERAEAPAEEEDPGPGPEQTARLQAVYEALVPYFAVPEDSAAEPLYAPGGDWTRALEEFEFTDEGRIRRLRLRYPASFRDGEQAERLRVERLLSGKSGRGREYRFDWDEERNRLEVTVLGPLPAGVSAQRFVTGPGEVLLGFTDAADVHRTVPVLVDGAPVDLPPVLWRTGRRSTEPHLLAMGTPGGGTSSLLRSIALQALEHGDVAVVDGGGAGEFACLAGRAGVLAVESSLVGALATLEWAVRETERRLLEASRARQAGEQPADHVRRPLWLLIDRPSVLSQLAAAEGRRDPQDLLQVPLRHGRAAGVTVAVAEQFEGADGLGEAVRAYTRARAVLGAVTPEEARAVLGEAPQSAPADDVSPGRGFARLGQGPVLRMRSPATPDPYDEAATAHERQAVMDLLPPRTH
ncbi:hypothetical protein [Streptomyces sp. ODS28]|uniref:hypothetical protein n=1 Tax=Streptomyces sp. ODS28 TaxID=3136688 RepID=UPI0031E5E1B9